MLICIPSLCRYDSPFGSSSWDRDRDRYVTEIFYKFEMIEKFEGGFQVNAYFRGLTNVYTCIYTVYIGCFTHRLVIDSHLRVD